MRVVLLSIAALALAGGFLIAAEEEAVPVDIVTVLDGKSFRGHILSITEDGLARLKSGGDDAVKKLDVTTIRHISLNTERNLPRDYLKRRVILHLSDGSRITGSFKEWHDDSVVIRNEYCTTTILKRGITDMSFALKSEVFLPYNDGESDILVLEEKPDEKLNCEIVVVRELDLKYKTDGKEHGVGFNGVRAVSLAGSEKPLRKTERDGWYAAVEMQNRDRLVGTLIGMDEETLTLLTRYTGPVSLKRILVNKVSFSDSLLFSSGNILITCANNNLVIMHDSAGKQLWEYKGCRNPWDAITLPDGNILVPSYSQDMSLRVLSPQGKEIRKLTPAGIKTPISAVVLENGNYLVAELNKASLAEVTPDGKIKRRYFEGKVPNPIHIELTRDGEVLIAHSGQNYVSKWSLKDEKMTWRKDGLGNSCGAVELGNGYIAVMEYGSRRVRVFDKDGNAKWTVNTNGPFYAIGVTPDGNALIPVLQNRNNRSYTILVEYTPTGEKVREITLREGAWQLSSIRQD